MNYTSFLESTETELVPFFGIIFPYVEKFLDIDKYVSPSLKNNLQNTLLEELSAFAEVTLQSELEQFVSYNNDSTFEQFIIEVNSSLSKNYPVLDEKLKTQVLNFSNHIFNIVDRFNKDIQEVIKIFNLNISIRDLNIINIKASLGDGHNGEGTALIYLSNGTKLIYKPRNVEITNSYNAFIDWINSNLYLDLKTFKVLNRQDYGWLEFIEDEKIDHEKDLHKYYQKAGILSAVTLLLGSKDYHRENIIASGKNPVLIDHETIIQPFLSSEFVGSWDEKHKISYFSVLESALIINPNTGLPSDLAGFGVPGKLEVTEVDKKVINSNTIDSKRIIQFVTRKLVEKNVPIYKNNYIFVNQYKEDFCIGFSMAYDLFLSSKEELKSQTSPLQSFKSKLVRYVWRPTFVYFKILKYLRNPVFMSGFEVYHSKLRDLLSKAYKREEMEEYQFILDFEIKQMMNGDIPIFILKSEDNFLEGNKSFKIFESNCLENIYKRIDLLSDQHKKEQLAYIKIWLNS
ncbi:type 2 lanthipeptide synthetase LanM [Chryseobacterium sp. Leaf201]|uniref:type 2 lanthipeptide synthetase LanM n=1 Tax=Chryseobacterium sp. Leaf201 TaxID=1735672 RepID=UPI0007005039|nr:type 2 lanthipeptide synthetase LanM [Chryseobacterium sp. Leaf201]KQM32213.1 hypothetical protein ASE55_16655 [Chryseobacterium sp. Leaf201]